jgi:hypothetical protein
MVDQNVATRFEMFLEFLTTYFISLSEYIFLNSLICSMMPYSSTLAIMKFLSLMISSLDVSTSQKQLLKEANWNEIGITITFLKSFLMRYVNYNMKQRGIWRIA